MPVTDITIGERIKELRLTRGMSTEDVSLKSGISKSTLSGIENHLISPPLGNIISLANAFEVSVGEFFGDSADSPFCIVRSDDRKNRVPVQFNRKHPLRIQLSIPRSQEKKTGKWNRS